MRYGWMMPLVLASGTLAACTSVFMTNYDKDTEYRLSERPNGFTLVICYSGTRMTPENGAGVCRQLLRSVAHDLAGKLGRLGRDIDEQKVELAFGRNGLTGITTCWATVPVEWQQATQKQGQARRDQRRLLSPA